MKRIHFKPLFLIAGSLLILSSCYKRFDPATYQPPLDIGGYTSASQIASSSLIGLWSFEGGLKDSVSGNTLTNTGTAFSTGLKGQGMQGALNSYALTTPSAAVANMQSFTIAYWVNSPAPSNGIIGLVNLAKTDGFWGNIDMFFENGSTNDNGKFRAHVTNGATEAWTTKDGITKLFDKWNHIALTYDAASETFKLFVNGSVIVTNPVPGFGPIHFTNLGGLVFGCVQFQTTPSQTSSTGSQPWASYLTGRLDEVRIYDKALSDAELSALVLLEGRGK